MTRLHHILLLLLIIANLFNISSSNSSDEFALLDFKKLITNADTTLNWTHNTHFCSWIGVTCSRQTRVISLTLPSMNLQGIISPSLQNLSFLATLDLTNNTFHGGFLHLLLRSPNLRTISLGDNNLSYDELSNGDDDDEASWNLPHLRILNLTNNNITSSLPRSITNATKLERLILSGNGVGGEIPVALGNMSSLVELDLSRNRLSGTIPPSLFSISSLRSLFLSNNSLQGSFSLYEDQTDTTSLQMEAIDLSSNQLTGEIPSGVCRFAKLTSLSLSYNGLTGQIPTNIGCLSRLESLYMTGNRITGPIPPSLGNISSLQYLGCVSKVIGGRIPRELGNLPDARMLGFDFNNLAGEITPLIFNLSSLEYIAFTQNDLSGRIPATLGLNLPNLQGIFLADNRLEGEIPIAITNASELTELELSYNLFTCRVPNNLGNLKKLIFLNLGGNRLSNEPGKLELGFLDSLVECRMLQFVIVANNPLLGTLPDSMQNFSSSIEMFNLKNARISGRIPRGIGNMSSMISLVLNRNNFTGNIPSEIGYLKELQRIYLNNNKLQGHIPLGLCNLSNLGEVLLSENNLSGSIPPCIGSLPRLQRLMLGNNRVSSTLPVTLWWMRNLLFMNVSKNMIQGEVPSEIGMLQSVEGLDLSGNRFSGVIPTTLGQLQRLRFLHLSNNSFRGPIPVSLGNLISLETLDLSFNDLSGAIPASLERLSYLREINLSYNHLEGAVPTSGIFANSSPRSFVGNRDLCGMPFLQVPLCRRNETSQRSRSQKQHVIKIVVPVVLSVAVATISAFSIWILLRRRTREKLEDLELQAVAARKGISYQEILRATDGFAEANLVGVGSSGSVFKGILPDATAIAVKVLSKNNDDDEDESQSRFDAECQVLKQIRHRNLVKVITTCSNDDLRAIVLQYMPNGSLDRWLHNEDNGCVLDLLHRIEIMLDVAMAIDYLHNGYEFPVVHCDLKPANVLLDADMVAHLSDFGISKILTTNNHTTRTKTLGTIGYIAPEYGSEGTVSAAGDVYSYGIMLMEVVTRRRPTDGLLLSEDLRLREWVKVAYPTSLMEVVDPNLATEINHACLASLVELSLQCSDEAPKQRISIKDVLIRLNKIKLDFLRNKGF